MYTYNYDTQSNDSNSFDELKSDYIPSDTENIYQETRGIKNQTKWSSDGNKGSIAIINATDRI